MINRDDERSYLQRRLAAERQLAAEGTTQAIRDAHMVLAVHYERKLSALMPIPMQMQRA